MEVTEEAAVKVTALRVWALWAVPTVLVVVTYSRLPAQRLYRVSGSGLAAGLGRGLVYVAFPVSLVAIAVVGATYGAMSRRWQRSVALGSIALCATVMTGMINPDDLDFRPINLLPVAGVVLAAFVTVAARWPGVVSSRLTIVAAVVMGLLSMPWLAAHVGFSLPGRLFLTDQLVAEVGEPGPVPAVHLGDHHGLYAALLVVTALALWRAPRSIPFAARRRALHGYLALLLSYGAVNLVQDFWGEQIATRGWTAWVIPDALQPGLTVMWGIVVVGAVMAYLLPVHTNE
jgi:hypothetical protein